MNFHEQLRKLFHSWLQHLHSFVSSPVLIPSQLMACTMQDTVLFLSGTSWSYLMLCWISDCYKDSNDSFCTTNANSQLHFGLQPLIYLWHSKDGRKHREDLFIHCYHAEYGLMIWYISQKRLRNGSKAFIAKLQTIFLQNPNHFIFQVRPQGLLMK